jgi:Shedu protein SduA, C-terminal/PcrA/UvrD tudor domain
MASDVTGGVIGDHGDKARAFPGSFVQRGDIAEGDIVAYEAALAEAEDEPTMQRFLDAHPGFLVQDLAGGRDGWVIPQARLGSEHVTDFLIAKEDYGGIAWYAVELERPQARIFTKKGDPSAALTHALRQVADWRIWLSRNLDYAARPRLQSGLGLMDIDPQLEGLIIMGRDQDLDRRESNARRQSLERAHHVRIRTYDWLATQARERIAGKPAAPDSAGSSRRGLGDYLIDAIIAAPLHKNPARDAIESAFGGIAMTWASPSAARNLEYEGVFLPFGRGLSDEINVPLSIVGRHPEGQLLELRDWKDWTDYVQREINADCSLLVTEKLPAEDLVLSLSEDREGVWHDPQPFSQNPGEAGSFWFSRLDVLVYLPAAGDHAATTSRLAAAREVFRHFITLPREQKDAREMEVASKAALLALAPGDTVNHDKFGSGKVVSVSGSGAQTEARIDFGAGLGVKLLVVGYAPMTRS